MRSVLVCAALALFAPAAFAAKTEPAAAARAAARVHIVQPGQTLGRIARRYGISIAELCQANRIRRRDPIRPKQELFIPGSNPKPEPARSAERPARNGATTASTRQPLAEGRRRTATASTSRSKAAAKDQAKQPDYAKRPKRRGYVVLVGPMGSWQGQARLPNGQVTAAARRGFMKMLASWRNGASEKIHGDLIRLIARVSDHFGGRPIRVVSGYRPYSTKQQTAHSRHNLGRAIDFSIPGVPNTVVRDYCRTLGDVGVGYYPNSSFVHLDVREAPTYWVDYAGPGQAPRYAHARARRPLAPPADMASTSTSTESAAGGSNNTQTESEEITTDFEDH
jgi:uncharacterized protein YcbK (DUF882 family)